MDHTCTHFGSVELRGEKELADLLEQGWQIVHVDDSETWFDREDKLNCRLYKYRLWRESLT